MLKFFRQYNKIILVIGCGVLMVAFLVPQALQMFGPNPMNVTAGHSRLGDITRGDLGYAQQELGLLERFGLSPLIGSDDPLRWVLITREIEELGLGASSQEIAEFYEVLGASESLLTDLARASRVTRRHLDDAVRRWLAYEQYRLLLQGHTLPAGSVAEGNASPGLARLSALAMLRQFGGQQLNPWLMQMVMGRAEGGQRLSETLLGHFLQDQQARVSGQFVLVTGSENAAEEPTEAQLQELFTTYRDSLPGQGQPQPFGYRTPEGLKLAYLVFPIENARSAVSHDEAELLDYYEANADQFRATTEGAPSPRPYLEVRDEVRRRVIDQKAADHVAEAVKFAQQRISDQERRLTTEAAYKVIPADYQAPDLQAIATAVQERFAIAARVVDHTTAWLSVDEATQLPGLASSALDGRRDLSFGQYLRSLRELAPSSEDPITALRLQVGVFSQPLTDFGGTRYLFRVTEARQARSPETLDQVRDAVLADARRLTAYEALLAEQNALLTQAKADGLQALADARGAFVQPLPPTTQSTLTQGQADFIPAIPGLGREPKVVGAIFDLARTLEPGDLQDRPEADRLVASPVPGRLSVALVRVDEFLPLARSAFDAQLADPQTASQVSMILAANNDQDPLSLEALKLRNQHREPGARTEVNIGLPHH